MKELFYYFLICIFFVACTSKNEKADKENVKKTDSIESDTTKVDNQNSLKFGFEIFTNMEQVPFCLPLPLKNYKLNEGLSNEKAKFVFVNEKDTNYYFEVQGLFRDDKLTIIPYFDTYYQYAEEEGKIIEESFKMQLQNSFYAMGYYSNFPENKFLEITWLRKDEVIRFIWFYEKERQNEIKAIANYLCIEGSECIE